MIFSESWLREFVDPGMATAELVETLTMAGLEVDGVTPAASQFSGIVVGRVESAEQHPDADKLSVCRVSDGTTEFQVVCGAPNVRVGLLVPFARVGAVLDGGDKPFKIKAAKLRGVESNGMLCSAEELGLAESSDGLLELPETLSLGADIRLALSLDDQLIELDLTPNRGDCLGMIGLAREVGVLARTQVNEIDYPTVKITTERKIPVATAALDECPKYLGRVIENINIATPSPYWLQERLRRSGLRSIDPVVDVTNLMLLELGHPMHAFDADKLHGTVTARLAKEGEKLTLLDDREVVLDSATLLIADDTQGLAMAGIMGGLSSSVTSQTKSIFLECAFFSQLAIAGKARGYGLHTDASHRYERGVDYALQARALERATALLLEIVGGDAGPVSIAIGNLPKTRQVRLKFANVKRLLGVDVPQVESVDILTRLGFVEESSDAEGIVFTVPSFRFDVSIEADLIEEIARVFGYNNLPETPGMTAQRLPKIPERIRPVAALKQRLVAEGYQEAINYSFIDPELVSSVCRESQTVVLKNPISAEMSVMRPSILPGLLSTLSYNLNRQRERVRLFEEGLVFEKVAGEIKQTRCLAGLIYGSADPINWNQPKKLVDFYDIKGIVESLADKGQHAEPVEFVKSEHPAMHSGQCAEVRFYGKCLGHVGAIHPRLQRQFGFASAVYLFELNTEALVTRQLPAASVLSRYPEVSRDLAIVVGVDTAAGDIAASIRANAGSDLTELMTFDVYDGAGVGEGKKSIAFGLTWQHPSRTLSDEEISAIITNCIKVLESDFKAELRI
ncbi:phenylalanine--tRNA ligase subunit beta [Gammaproteobacteria bacterium]|nr:phenylalanine--tRNA ligase subunit beta [Gammaproteobacteria bacterium]MDB2374822.1 phenylalanine--tRNA ligase subunit beta [Gammaproteobacteria bacterium]